VSDLHKPVWGGRPRPPPLTFVEYWNSSTILKSDINSNINCNSGGRGRPPHTLRAWPCQPAAVIFICP